MAITIAVANSKGGIGKTTTALCLSDALRRRGKRVLLIDTDPQKSATEIYQAKTNNTPTLGDMMYEHTDAQDCIQHTSMGDIIASDTALTSAETTIPADADRFYHLQDACQKINSKYDYIICDCPPGNGVLLGNVLSFVRFVVIPITCDRFGMQGLTDFADVMHMYSKRINTSLQIAGVLMVKYKGRQSLTRDLEENLIPSIVEQMNTTVFKTKIRESVKCQEAQALGVSLYDYAPKSTTAQDYSDFTAELMEVIKSET